MSKHKQNRKPEHKFKEKKEKKKQNFFLGLGRTRRNRKFLKLIY